MVRANAADDMEGIGGKMVEILNLLLLLGFREGWSVCSPEWRKYFRNKILGIIASALFWEIWDGGQGVGE